MSSLNGLFQLLVTCPRCDARNAVDVRKQGIARRARCGRCGEPLPRRLPAPLTLLLVAAVIVVAGLTQFAVGAVREHGAQDRRARIERLMAEGRAAEAVSLLPEDRTPSSQDGVLARRVARALGEPVLAAERDATTGPAAAEAAIDVGDRLVEQHHEDLPELLELLDEPLRRLQARRTALDILSVAIAHADDVVPDLAHVESALQAATVAALDAPPDVAAAVDDLTPAIRARAALARARSLVLRRPEEARQVLARTAQRLRLPDLKPPAAPRDGDDDARPFAERIASLRATVESRDEEALVAAVRLRPEPSWSVAQRDEMDAEVRRACVALAAAASSRAAREWDPQARADALLRATTCDEVLPREFLAASRVALAETLAEAARRGGSLEDALRAWDGVASPRRDGALAAIGCMAEARGEPVIAVLAFSRVASSSALATLATCAQEQVEALPPPDIPTIGPVTGPGGG